MDLTNPYGMSTTPAYMQTPLQKTRIKQVNGRQGADAFQMAPGSSDILMDTNAPIIYVVVTDDAGFKTVTPFDITKHEEPQPVDMQMFTQKIGSIEQTLTDLSNRFATIEEAMRNECKSDFGLAGRAGTD